MENKNPSHPVSYSLKNGALTAALLIFLLLFCALTYTFVHEGGHTLMGLLFGGKLTSFNINFFDLSAHAGIEGEFSGIQNAIISASGVCLPLLVWTLFILLVPKKTDPLMELLKLGLSMIVINSFLAWVIIPIIVFSGGRVSDDSSNFLNQTHIHPLLVAGAALLIYIAGWVLFLYRLGGIKTILSRLRAARQIENFHSIRRTLVWMVLFTIAILGVVAVLGITLENPSYDNPPTGFREVAMLDLTERGYSNEAVYFFSLNQPTTVRLYFELKDIQSGPVSIDLAGPNGFSQGFMRYENVDFKAGFATINPAPLALQPGEYSILLTFPQTGGSVTISIWIESD